MAKIGGVFSARTDEHVRLPDWRIFLHDGPQRALKIGIHHLCIPRGFNVQTTVGFPGTYINSIDKYRM